MKSICFFSSYYTTPNLPAYVKYYLAELKRHFTAVVFLTNDKTLSSGDIQFLNSNNIPYRLYKNEGFDFGMWYKALQEFDIEIYDRVGLINDSCILFRKLDFFFEWVDKEEFDYCGMTDCRLIKYHIQSYFIIINKKAIPFIKKYFAQHGIITDLVKLIRTYEVGLSMYLIHAGMKLAPYYSFKDDVSILNPSIMKAKKLIKEGAPFIKKRILTRSCGDVSLIKHGFDPDPRSYIRLMKKLYPEGNIKELTSGLLGNRGRIREVQFYVRIYLAKLWFFYIGKICEAIYGILNRIVIKVKNILDRVLWPLYTLLKYLRLVRPVKYTVAKVIGPITTNNNPLPLNYSPKEEKTINHWRTYPTAELKILTYNNVNVSIKGIVFNGLGVSEMALLHPIFRFTFSLRYLFGVYLKCKKEEVKDETPCVLIFDHWSIGNYYHWVIDTLPRLQIMGEDMAKYKLILPYNTPLYAYQTLKAFKFKEVIKIKKNQYLRIPNLLVPHYTAGSGWQNKTVLSQLKNTLLKSHKIVEVWPEKIYVSRAKQKVRRVHNETEVKELVKKYGFSVIYFEEMSFWEQVDMMHNVKYFISSHGANITNIFFMPEKASVLELNRVNNTNYCYYSLAANMNLSYFYQLCEDIGHDDIVVDISLLKKNIELMLSKEL